MKRIFAVLMVLVLGGMVSGADSLIANGTSQSIQFVMYDAAGAEKTALVYTDIAVVYVIDGAAAVEVTEATLANASAAYSSGGIIKVDDTLTPGLYRFDVPNAACIVAAGTKRVAFYFISSGCKTTKAYYDLTPSVNTVLTNGTTPPTITVADGHVEANVVVMANDVITGDALAASAATEMAGASWDALWTSYTTENSFGWIVKRIYDKVMGLRK
jgi:hypothetical protein